MTSATVQRAAWAVAAVCLATGVGLTVQTLRAGPRLVQRLQRKVADVRELQNLEQAMLADDEAVRTFEQMPSQRPEPLGDVLRAAAPGLTADIRQKEPMPLRGGWVLRRTDVVFDQAALADVARFLYSAETRRPPWRLVECHMTAADKARGAGRVTLVLQALEKQGGGAPPGEG